MEVFALEGSHGYDLMGYTKEQVITDVLDHYERHLQFLHLNRADTRQHGPRRGACSQRQLGIRFRNPGGTK